MRSVTTMALAAGLLVIVAPTMAGEPVTPGTVMFDMDTHTEYCDPDYWSFFGNPLNFGDFGSNGVFSEDGHAVYELGDWTACDLTYGPQSCTFMGAKHGGGRIVGQPKCGGVGSGVRDADLDLSQGTGVTLRALLMLPDGGQPGVRLQFQLADTNGAPTLDPNTTAVVPRSIPGKPYINRAVPLNGEQTWQTITVWFDGLDYSYDGAAVAGTDGLDLTDINAVRTLWRRGPTSSGKNTIVFDEITLINNPPVLWADADSDGDVDLDDFGAFQRCFGEDPVLNPDCARMDANYDAVLDDDNPNNDVINLEDYQNFVECFEGAGVTSGFYPWCY